MWRWLGYLLAGTAFGVLDFFYLEWKNTLPWARLFGPAAAGRAAEFLLSFLILNLGLWLTVAVLVALCEARRSRSARRAALASVVAWVAADVAYYLTNAAQLAFLGVPGREEMHVAYRGAPWFGQNWVNTLRGPILGGILEWLPVALIGGALVGSLVGAVSLRRATRREAQGVA